GEIEQKIKKHKEAIQYFHKALNAFQHYFPYSKQRDKLKIQVALGQINTTQKKLSKGLQHFNNALVGLIPKYQEKNYWPENKSLYPENTLLDALKGKAKLLALQGKDSIALIGYQKAATVIEKLRKTIFSKEAKRLLQKQSLKTTESAIALAFKLYQKSKSPVYANIAFKTAEQHKARLLLNDLQKELSHTQSPKNDSLFIKQKRLKQAIAYYTHSYIQATLQQQSQDSSQWKHQIDQTQYQLSLIHEKIKNQYPNLNWDTSIRLKELFKNIPDSTIFREYFTGIDCWYAFAVSQQGVVAFSKLGKSGKLTAQVSNFINHWFSNGSGAMVNHPKAYFQKANQLYQKLSYKLPINTLRLTIIPDGILGRLPFEALITDSLYLPNPGKWPYLLLKAQTSQAYSLSVWNHLQNEFSQYNQQSGFAGFFIAPNKNSNLAELKGVQNEIKTVEKELRGEFFINKKANTKHLFKSIKSNAVIHISTHSFLMRENKIPALQMSNQKILLADLYPVDAHPSLIVISACQTANGLLSPGEGIISLARQFTAIGSGGVISALWSINDITAAKLTALFYQNLQQSKKKAFALYHAKRQWLNTPSRSAVHKLPYYWAGLVYYGNHVPLSNPLKTPTHFQYWLWIVGILLILAFLLFLLKKRKSSSHNKQ
ncbi:MAG TPA: CHAT domain-containing protein, partial [Chitinophagaceae bacterium]|nr:CHAT domain-containing protein [Chitinophagaceae bacterium]